MEFFIAILFLVAFIVFIAWAWGKAKDVEAKNYAKRNGLPEPETPQTAFTSIERSLANTISKTRNAHEVKVRDRKYQALIRLSELRDKGLITEEEFIKEKRTVMGD